MFAPPFPLLNFPPAKWSTGILELPLIYVLFLIHWKFIQITLLCLCSVISMLIAMLTWHSNVKGGIFFFFIVVPISTCLKGKKKYMMINRHMKANVTFFEVNYSTMLWIFFILMSIYRPWNYCWIKHSFRYWYHLLWWFLSIDTQVSFFMPRWAMWQ